MFAIATPAKQSVEDTIATLSSRLSSATLLEDRRAAVLGLKSLASSYPATVSSNALRGLIGCLDRDSQDIDTSLATLQTLLQLFNPDENSPEASNDIALWLADEFTQRQDNITLLLDLLDSQEIYPKLYSLKLLAAILSSRTERTKECIGSAPLGISKLVAVLDDSRDVIRNEGLSLLIYLTPNSTELQKKVAFEDAFERIFNIIKSEGSLVHGDRIVEDCLILLANLLRLNESNQTFFRETGFVPRVARLLSDATYEHQDNSLDLAEWVLIQRNRNLYALLAVIRLFLVAGGTSRQANQTSFWQNGVLEQALKLAFSHSTETLIQAEALVTCADIIRGESTLQENFAQLQVPSNTRKLFSERNVIKPDQEEIPRVYVIDGLLDLTLSLSIIAKFDSRIAACECIKAYLNNHSIIKDHFIRRAIDGHIKGTDETPNFLTILLQPINAQNVSDPYRHWFAGIIFFHLIFNDSGVKKLAMNVTEGDSMNGEEVISCLQNLTSNLLNGIKNGIDERILVSYLMLLCGWLFEDPDGVNDLLGEATHLQGLIQAILAPTFDSLIVRGLCAMLLGILYEFSTKDSPVSRSTINQILYSQLGRDKYIDLLSNLRSHTLFRDYEVLPQNLSSAIAGTLPQVFFDKLFVEFAKDNFSRMLRALDHDPQYEAPIVINGVQKGISREMIDALRLQLEEKSKMLEELQEKFSQLSRKRDQEQADYLKNKYNADLELSRIKQINESLLKHHKLEINELKLEKDRISQVYQRQLENFAKTAQNDAEQNQKNMMSERDDLKKVISGLELEIELSKSHIKKLENANDHYELDKNKIIISKQNLERRVAELEATCFASAKRAAGSEQSLAQKENEKQNIQGELDDLLMVFSDVEEKVSRYREKLKKLGEIVSDDEDEESVRGI